MKHLSVLFLIFLSSVSSFAVEYVALDVPSSTNYEYLVSHTLTLDAGQTAEYMGTPSESISDWQVCFGTNTTDWITLDTSIKTIVEGPALIRVRDRHLDEACRMYFKITTEDSLVSPSGAVVIPADDGGPVTIVLESSTDLVNWTEGSPGTYGTTTAKRFFRVRAVRSN